MSFPEATEAGGTGPVLRDVQLTVLLIMQS